MRTSPHKYAATTAQDLGYIRGSEEGSMHRANIVRAAALLGATAIGGIATLWGADPTLNGRIVAVGIPGISAISPVGSNSNFGEPLAVGGQLPGSFLSIDPRGPVVLVVPPLFAAGGWQASALGGMVQMFSAQN